MMMNTAWLRLDSSFILVVPVALCMAPLSRRPYTCGTCAQHQDDKSVALCMAPFSSRPYTCASGFQHQSGASLSRCKLLQSSRQAHKGCMCSCKSLQARRPRLNLCLEAMRDICGRLWASSRATAQMWCKVTSEVAPLAASARPTPTGRPQRRRASCPP